MNYIPTIHKILKYSAVAFVLSGLLILLIYARLLWNDGFRFWGRPDNAVSSQVGSFIGGVVGPLWTLATFFILYLALTTQRQQINEQLREQRYAKFETTFFNMIRTHHEITNIIHIEDERNVGSFVSGKDFFSWASIDFKDLYEFLSQPTYEAACHISQRCTDTASRYSINEGFFTLPRHNPLLVSQITYKLFYEKWHSLIGHYYRNLFHILKFVDDTRTWELNKVDSSAEKLEICKAFQKYVSFIQAQLSIDELFLLFYALLCYGDMKDLVEKYNLLENLPLEDLIAESHGAFYSPGIKRIIEMDCWSEIMLQRPGGKYAV